MRRIDRAFKGGSGLLEDAVGAIFPGAQQDKRNGRGRDEEFGAARDLGFRLPTEKLHGKEKGKDSPDNQRDDFRVAAEQRGRINDDLLKRDRKSTRLNSSHVSI